MKSIKSVAAALSLALVATEPGTAAVAVLPHAGGAGPVASAAGLASMGRVSGPFPSLAPPNLVLPTPVIAPAALLVTRRPEQGLGRAVPVQGQAAARPVLAVAAAGGAVAGDPGLTPVVPASSMRGAQASFRKRAALLARGVEGIASSRDIGEQRGELDRLFDSRARREGSSLVYAGGDARPYPASAMLIPSSRHAAGRRSSGLAGPPPGGVRQRGGAAEDALRKMNAVALAGALGGALFGPLVPATVLWWSLFGGGLVWVTLSALPRQDTYDHPVLGPFWRAVAIASVVVVIGGTMGLVAQVLGAIF